MINALDDAFAAPLFEEDVVENEDDETERPQREVAYQRISEAEYPTTIEIDPRSRDATLVLNDKKNELKHVLAKLETTDQAGSSA